MPSFLEWCRTHEADAMGLLEELVAIDSGPDQHDGFEAVIQIAERELAALGLLAGRCRVGPGIPVIVATTDSKRPGRGLLLLAHLDTVFPPGTSSLRPFTVEGDKALGPGVADMKGGFVGMLLALRCLRDYGSLSRYELTILVNCDEEIGSTHSRPLIEAKAREASAALSFEPARPDGSLVTTRRGHRRYRVEITGRAAHTGVNPDSGANAIVTLARWISALETVRADLPAGTSATVSLIDGGTSINTVPDRATASVDVRIPDIASADTVETILKNLNFDPLPNTSVRLVQFAARPPMNETDGVERLISTIRAAAHELDIPVTFSSTGGSSDAGITTSVGVPSIDGLGPVGAGYHTDEEFLEVPTLIERAALAATVIHRWHENRSD